MKTLMEFLNYFGISLHVVLPLMILLYAVSLVADGRPSSKIRLVGDVITAGIAQFVKLPDWKNSEEPRIGLLNLTKRLHEHGRNDLGNGKKEVRSRSNKRIQMQVLQNALVNLF